MTRYIAFLRGVNVGGRMVKMDRLRQVLEEFGLRNVRSYIQTGNVSFETDDLDWTTLTGGIEKHLATTFGFAIPVFLRTFDELQAALALNPFKDIPITKDTRHVVAFIDQPIPDDVELPFVSAKGDFEIVHVTPGEVYVVMHLIDGRPGNPIAFIERKYKLKATARFFHTTVKILDAFRTTLDERA